MKKDDEPDVQIERIQYDPGQKKPGQRILQKNEGYVSALPKRCSIGKYR
ncbi:hypothetical protein RCO48_26030 [Peribacillus frigoritolerans]|nr:hypothetical protein [Peribacillus frigoritolerans]